MTPTRVTQGKTYNDNEETYGAALAVDGNVSTFSSTLTEGGMGWVKLEFGKPHFILKIICYHRFFNNWYNPKSWCVESEANFRSCAENENNVDVSVYQGDVLQKSCGTLELKYGLEQSDHIYSMACNTAGDTVKLSKSTVGLINLFEIVAIGAPGNLQYS